MAEQYSTLAQHFLQGAAFDDISEKDGTANAASYSKDTSSTKASHKWKKDMKKDRKKEKKKSKKKNKERRNS